MPGADTLPFAIAYGVDPTTGYADTRARETAIQECMAQHGFPYVPYDPHMGTEQMATATAAALDVPGEGGYGIAATLLPRAAPDSDHPVDQNNDYLDQLVPAERDAYLRALFGAVFDDPTRPSDDGCVAAGNDEVPAQNEQVRLWLEQAKSDVLTRARSARAVLDTAHDWSTCMAVDGFQFPSRFDALEQLRSEFRAVYDAVVGDGISAGPTAESPALQAFHQREAAIAEADRACDEATGFTAAYIEALVNEQQQFVDQHPDVGE